MESNLFWPVILIVLVERSFEMGLGHANLLAMLDRGAQVIRRDGIRPIVFAHSLFVVGMIAEFVWSPWAATGPWTVPLLALGVAAYILRFYVMVTLGRRWTTRVVVLPSVSTTRRGPYRFMDHPNYLAVMVELAVLPLAFGAVGTALLVGIINGFALKRRITIEDDALAAAAKLTTTGGRRRPGRRFLPTR